MKQDQRFDASRFKGKPPVIIDLFPAGQSRSGLELFAAPSANSEEAGFLTAAHTEGIRQEDEKAAAAYVKELEPHIPLSGYRIPEATLKSLGILIANTKRLPPGFPLAFKSLLDNDELVSFPPVQGQIPVILPRSLIPAVEAISALQTHEGPRLHVPGTLAAYPAEHWPEKL